MEYRGQILIVFAFSLVFSPLAINSVFGGPSVSSIMGSYVNCGSGSGYTNSGRGGCSPFGVARGGLGQFW